MTGKNIYRNTLCQTCCGILRYIRELKLQLDIFRDAAFASFRQTLDAEVKHWKAGVHTKQIEPITPDEEELLWSKNLLGAQSPQTLVDTWCIFVELPTVNYSGCSNVSVNYDLGLCGQFGTPIPLLAFQCGSLQYSWLNKSLRIL